jgi:F0F1-type ATP synthase assembly protein I
LERQTTFTVNCVLAPLWLYGEDMESQINGVLIALGIIGVVCTVVSLWIKDQLDWSLSSIIGVSFAIVASCIGLLLGLLT